ncbi:MAG: Dps family protein [Chlamydiota bacterium]
MEKDKLALDIGLNEGDRKKISDVLHQLLGSMYALYIKTQNYHWNVTGITFPSLHALFQNQYEELAEAIDEVAERIRALGFFPSGSFGSFLALSFISDETLVRPAIEMVEQLLSDHQALITFMRQHLSAIEKTGDGATADLINKRLAIHEKAAWILRSTSLKS